MTNRHIDYKIDCKTYQLREPNFKGHQLVTKFYLDLKRFNYNIELEPHLTVHSDYLRTKQREARDGLSHYIDNYLWSATDYKIDDSNPNKPVLTCTVDIAYFDNEVVRREVKEEYEFKLDQAKEIIDDLFSNQMDLNQRIIDFEALPWYTRIWKAWKKEV